MSPIRSTSLGADLQDPLRLAAVRRVRSARTPDEQLDRLTEFAARTVRASIAALTVLDGSRQHFLSQFGLPAPIAVAGSTPVQESFCRHVVLRGRHFQVRDAKRDPLFFASPLVREYGMRAYAGVPVRTRDGHLLGAFCLVDFEPRDWTEHDLRALVSFGRLAAIEVERIAPAHCPA